MRRIWTVLLLVSSAAWAADVDPNVTATEEMLVRLAWESHPANQVYSHEIRAAEAKQTHMRKSWSDEFRWYVGFYNGAADPNNGAGFFDETDYNFGFSISLGAMINNRSRATQAREGVEIARLEEQSQRVAVRSEVLRRYHAYLYSIERLKIRSHTAEDAHGSYLSVVKKFEDGSITLENLHLALSIYNRAREEELEARHDVRGAKFTLEEMINRPFEEVESMVRAAAETEAEGEVAGTP